MNTYSVQYDYCREYNVCDSHETEGICTLATSKDTSDQKDLCLEFIESALRGSSNMANIPQAQGGCLGHLLWFGSQLA